MTEIKDSPELAPGDIRVLVVDNDPPLATAMVESLESVGYDISIAICRAPLAAKISCSTIKFYEYQLLSLQYFLNATVKGSKNRVGCVLYYYFWSGVRASTTGLKMRSLSWRLSSEAYPFCYNHQFTGVFAIECVRACVQSRTARIKSERTHSR